MGIYDRDYYREQNTGWWSTTTGRHATYGLMIVTCIVFLLQLMTRPERGWGPDLVAEWGEFYYPAILQGQVWRLITPIFLHDSTTPWHIALNMLVLYWVGTALEGIYGTREFLTFYLFAGFVVSVGMCILAAFGVKPNVPSLGASGAVTAALFVFACHYPHQKVLLFFVIPVPVWLLAVGIVVMNVSGAAGAGRANIGYNAHLIGAAFGLLYFTRQFRISVLFDRVGDVRPKRNVRSRLSIYRGPAEPEVPMTAAVGATRAAGESRSPRSVDEQLEAKLDQVLEKVSRYGRESLTPEENDILLRASEIYKRRRGN